MKSLVNIFITKLRKKLKMYFAFPILYMYMASKTFYNSIGGIIVFKNSEDIYPYYFFTPYSNISIAKTNGNCALKFFTACS